MTNSLHAHRRYGNFAVMFLGLNNLQAAGGAVYCKINMTVAACVHLDNKTLPRQQWKKLELVSAARLAEQHEMRLLRLTHAQLKDVQLYEGL